MEETLTLQGFLETGDHFLQCCLREMAAGGFPEGCRVDHLAYICSSHAHYQELRSLLLHPTMHEIETGASGVTVVGMEFPFRGSLREKKVLVDVVELCHQPVEGEPVSRFHHVGLLPNEGLGIDEFAARIFRARPGRSGGYNVVRAQAEKEPAYDVLMEDGLLVRVSGTSLMDHLLELEMGGP